MLDETVPGLGLQKPVHRSISQAVRSTQNPAPDKIRSSIPSTTLALPGGRLLVGFSAKKRENRTSSASQCQLSFLLLPNPGELQKAATPKPASVQPQNTPCSWSDLSPLLSIIIQVPPGPFPRLIHDYKVQHCTSYLLFPQLTSSGDPALEMCSPNWHQGLYMSTHGPQSALLETPFCMYHLK